LCRADAVQRRRKGGSSGKAKRAEAYALSIDRQGAIA
jgi:hypothetical protein